MSRIAAAFESLRKEGRAALIAYLMAGDPTMVLSEELALACIRGGADILELGIPFSDPIADGPEIQAAGRRALKAGTRPRDVIELAARLRSQTGAPLVLMTYLNPLLAMGLEAFATRAAAAGVDGLIVPDLSLEESAEILAITDGHGLDLVQLVAPSTPPDRARAIAAASRGFVYIVARYGTTGTRSDVPDDVSDRLAHLRSVSPLPMAVGFGVSSPGHVRVIAAAGADGVIVGSAIVQRAASSENPTEVERFVSVLAGSLEAGPVPPRPSVSVRLH